MRLSSVSCTPASEYVSANAGCTGDTLDGNAGFHTQCRVPKDQKRRLSGAQYYLAGKAAALPWPEVRALALLAAA
jgi:hypothetical protein